MRLGMVVAALMLGGCAQVTPIVKYSCMGCTALLASGVCRMVSTAPGEAKVAVPECKAGEVAVIKNWNDVGKGAAPVLGCKKESK